MNTGIKPLHLITTKELADLSKNLIQKSKGTTDVARIPERDIQRFKPIKIHAETVLHNTEKCKGSDLSPIRTLW